jgi:hypothetical protein
MYVSDLLEEKAVWVGSQSALTVTPLIVSMNHIGQALAPV